MHPLVTSAPWWGAPLLAGLFLLIGSGLTLLVTWLRGRHEQQLTDKRRWDDLILDTCVEVERICYELVGISRRDYPKFIANMDERMEHYLVLIDQLNEARAKFRFVASEELKQTSLDLFGMAVEEFVGSPRSDAGEKFEAARTNFVNAARKELRAN